MKLKNLIDKISKRWIRREKDKLEGETVAATVFGGRRKGSSEPSSELRRYRKRRSAKNKAARKSRRRNRMVKQGRALR
jgi:hypothetical protein